MKIFRLTLFESVQETAFLPPWPRPDQTIGPNGMVYQNLQNVMNEWVRHAARGGTIDTFPDGYKKQMKTDWPAYFVSACSQRLEAGGGINVWQRRWGNPWLEAGRQLNWWINEMGMEP